MSADIPNLQDLKSRLKATWSAGDFGQIARIYEARAAEFIADLEIQKGERVLDVACGTGNLALPAARKGANVTGVDIAVNLVEQARAHAAAEGLAVKFDEGDAEALPYGDGEFDTVVTMFGAMFCPRPERAAAELVRVCRHGGRVVMANWVPASFVGQMFKAMAAHVPPPAGMPSPLLWGDESVVRTRFGDAVSDLGFAVKAVTFEFPLAPADVVEFWRTYYGPTQKAFAALDEPRQHALRTDLTALWTQHNRAKDGTTRVASDYLRVIARRA